MTKTPEYFEIDRVKERIIDNALIFGSILGFASFAISLFGLQRSNFKFGVLFDFVTLFIFFITLLLRKKLSLKVKSAIIITGIFVLVFLDIYKHGVFSDNKTLLIIIPFFAFLVYSLRNSILIFLLSSLFYLAFGIFYCLKIFKPTSDYYVRAFAIDVWILNFLLISIIAFVVVIAIRQFNIAFLKLISDLKNKNTELNKYKEELESLVAERTNDLEAANEELTAMNEELYEKSNIINDQNLELKATMQHLQDTQSQLIQTEKMASLGILTAGVAHEINNPLNYILGGYTGLENYFQEAGQLENETIKILLNCIKTGVERSMAIVNGLNQFNRDKENFNEDCDIHAIIENCLLMLYNKTLDRIEIQKSYFTDSYSLTGNVGKLHQVFLNIIYNSIQSIENEGKITIKTTKPDQFISIEISDTGCGISKENLPRIIDPFFTTKDPGEGTGLGLSITYSILQEHNGTLEFLSEIHKGTTVKITLPIKKDE